VLSLGRSSQLNICLFSVHRICQTAEVPKSVSEFSSSGQTYPSV